MVRYLSTISWFIGAGAYVVIDNRRKRAGDTQEVSSDADDDDGRLLSKLLFEIARSHRLA